VSTVVIAAVAISTIIDIDGLVVSSVQGGAGIFPSGEKIPAPPFFVTACQEYLCPCFCLRKFSPSLRAGGFSIDTGF
jgi:hypothetical protein